MDEMVASGSGGTSLGSVNGFFFDELSKLRVLDGDKLQQTQELREECKEFVDRTCMYLSTPTCP